MDRRAATDRAAGLALGFAADRLFGDPRRFHPVAGFGRVASRWEHVLHADSVARGAVHTVTLVGGATVLGRLAEVHADRWRVVVTAVCTWAVVGGRSLEREAVAVGDLLDSGDLPAARQRLTHLVGRDPSNLDESEIARAVVESVAENTSDAVVAPLWWGGLLGPAGLLGHRAVNTLDAMVGHHTERYERFGTVAARLDDVANLAPARLSAMLAALAAPSVAGRPAEALQVWRRDAGGHPSPNAGPVESAFAGALGLRLGGTNVYGTRLEHRPVMGDGRDVATADIGRAITLARWVGRGAVVTALLGVGLSQIRRRRG